MTSHLQTTFEQTLSGYLAEQDTLVVAYSGGLDSTCLLLLAHQYSTNTNRPLTAIHVNHQISKNAGQWQAHCEAVCARFSIPLRVKVVSVAAHGDSLEAVARQQRYAAIAEASEETDIILLGQHKDDQAETLLLQLLRGAGPQGLSAMAEYAVNQHGTRLLRPLLGHSKQDLKSFIADTGVSWVEDESNADSRFDRNFLRHEIMPVLSERWPGAIDALSRSVRHIQTHEQLLQEQVQDKFRSVLVANTRLSLPLLKQHSADWQSLIIKHWVKTLGHCQPSEKVLQRLLQDCLHSKPDSQPVVLWGGWQCSRFNDELYLFPERESLQTDAIEVSSERTLLPGDLGYIYFSKQKPDDDRINVTQLSLSEGANVRIEFGGFSRRFKPEDAPQSKPLKQWFQLWNIPPWQRKRMPLLMNEQQVLAVGNRIANTSNSEQLEDVSTYYYGWVS